MVSQRVKTPLGKAGQSSDVQKVLDILPDILHMSSFSAFQLFF